MPQLTIRKFSDDEYQALKAKADSAGMPLEVYAYEHLKMLIRQPTVQMRYILRAFNPDASCAMIRRVEDSMGHDIKNATPEQQHYFSLALEFVKRNGPGDREEAMKALFKAFEHVFETVM